MLNLTPYNPKTVRSFVLSKNSSLNKWTIRAIRNVMNKSVPPTVLLAVSVSEVKEALQELNGTFPSIPVVCDTLMNTDEEQAQAERLMAEAIHVKKEKGHAA